MFVPIICIIIILKYLNANVLPLFSVRSALLCFDLWTCVFIQLRFNRKFIEYQIENNNQSESR